MQILSKKNKLSSIAYKLLRAYWDGLLHIENMKNGLTTEDSLGLIRVTEYIFSGTTFCVAITENDSTALVMRARHGKVIKTRLLKKFNSEKYRSIK